MVNLRSIKSFKGYGFTFIEILIAIVLFATAMLSALELIQRSLKTFSDGENVLTATFLAQQKLEELRNVSFEALIDETKASITDPVGFTQFSREVDITTLSSTAPYNTSNLKQIDVYVYWNAPGGETHVTLETLRSNI